MTFYVQTKRVGKRFDLKELKNKISRHFFDILDWSKKNVEEGGICPACPDDVKKSPDFDIL